MIVWVLVASRIDWDNSLSTRWILAGKTHISNIIIPYEAKDLVVLKKSKTPNIISASPDMYTISRWKER